MVRGKFKKLHAEPQACDEILVKLLGGFGNQLFQLAYALEISNNSGLPIRLNMQKGPRPFALGVLGIENNKSFRLSNGSFLNVDKVKHSYRCGFYEYKHHGGNFLSLNNPPRHLILNGYFQSAKYFQEISSQLRETLIATLAIKSDESEYEYVVHIRLGDYVRKENILAIHGHINEDYLTRALQVLGWAEGFPLCIVTDDVISFRQLFPKYAELATKIQSSTLLEDFRLIASKKNKVISNSTFSWWAAWLGQGNVVAPKQWYFDDKILEESKKDLFPQNWILL